MFPLAQENKLRLIFQFYTKKRVKRAKKYISAGQIPLFELTDDEKRNIIKELTKVAIEVNLSTFESWRTLTDEELKRTDLEGAKYWIKKNYDLFNNTTVTADKLMDIRQQRIVDTIKNYNRNLDVLKNGEVPKSTLNALKRDIANNRASKEIKDIVKSIENRTYTNKDIDNLQKWLNNRNENLARNETGNLYAQECKDLMIENGIEHFVWHTMKDDRVRPEHAEREGLVFSINDELPGEDFNCRCWTEPIRLN